MKVRELINEMPLKAVSLHRSSTPGGLEPHELALVKKYIETNEYTNKLKAVPFDLYVYILDDAVAGEFGYNYPEGVLPPSIWKDGTKTVHSSPNTDYGSETIAMTDKVFTAMFKTIRAIAKKEPKSVHFILGDNHSDSDRISPTPWMIAHRLGHALFPGGLPNLHWGSAFSEKMGLSKKKYVDLSIVMSAGATMKSARSGNLLDDEVSSEFIAQYLVTGKISINTSAAFERFAELVDISDADEISVKAKFDEQIKLVVDRAEKLIDTRIEELTAKGAVVLYI